MLRDGAKGEKRGREKVTGGVWALRQGWIQGTGQGAKGEGSLAWKASPQGGGELSLEGKTGGKEMDATPAL